MHREELIEHFLDNQQAVLKAWKSHFQKIMGESSLTPTKLSLLHIIHHEQPISSGELATKMRISRSAITQLVDVLDRLCLIERCEDEADRRITLIRLSKQGRRKVEEFETARTKVLERLASDLSDDELRSIIAVNHKMIKELEA